MADAKSGAGIAVPPGWPQTPEAFATALARAFPYYTVRVRRDGGQPRYEAVSRDGRNPICLISPDAQEIWAELNGA